jgi:transposase
MKLTDAQWELLEPLFEIATEGGRGRPRRDARGVLDGILWILKTGARWCDLPRQYPPYQTCHRRFQEWVEDGTLDEALRRIAQDLKDRGGLDVREAFIDGTSAVPKKGALRWENQTREGTKPMAVADRHGLPVAVCITSASPHEVTLVEETLDAMLIDEAPAVLVGDKAYDSDPLDERLRTELGIELVAPHKGNRKKAAIQDGRPLRRYRRCWKVERLFAWLQNYRRLVVRYERHAANFLGFVQLGCMLILMRHF